MKRHPFSSKKEEIVHLGPKFETLSLIDKLMEENQSLKMELVETKNRLRTLQSLVHWYLMKSDDPPALKGRSSAGELP